MTPDDIREVLKHLCAAQANCDQLVRQGRIQDKMTVTVEAAVDATYGALKELEAAIR